MGRKSKSKKPAGKAPQQQGKPAETMSYAPAKPPGGVRTDWIAGLVLLTVCTVVSGIMVAGHFDALELPGCGEGTACAAAANSVWGKIPLGDVEWPVSFLGLAFFAGMLGAWIGSKRGVQPMLRQFIRLGAVVSVVFVGVMIANYDKYFCKYCLAIHACNLVFWLLTELTRKSTPVLETRRPLAATAIVFLAASVALYAGESSTRADVDAKQEKMFAESTEEIISKTQRQGSKTTTGEERVTAVTEPVADTDEHATATPDPVSDRPWTGPFTGRWRLGPEEAAVRIVMYTDYQCTDCTRIEGEIREKFPQWESVSLSIKHYPMDNSCNMQMTRPMHGAACWAAKAAEAVGILGGNEAYFDMHHLLFDQQGDFRQMPLTQLLQEYGIAYADFQQVLSDPNTLERVQSDIAEAQWLGLHFTPFVFINGVELRGVFARQAVIRAVDSVLATNPEPATSAVDDPPPAVEKCVGDWREGRPRRSFGSDARSWPLGPDDARVKILVWADYQEQYSVLADRTIREWMAGRDDVQYLFRHFPFDQSCNSSVSRTAHPKACLAHKAVEAAADQGGADAYWKMHVWLMENRLALSEKTLRTAAAEMGLDPDALFARMESPEVRAAIEEDGRSGKNLLFRSGIPTIYINRKVVPRWRLNKEVILPRILDEAYGE